MRFKKGAVLLRIDSVGCRFNVVNSSCFYNFPSDFDVVFDRGAALAYGVLSCHLVLQNSSIEPCALVDANIC